MIIGIMYLLKLEFKNELMIKFSILYSKIKNLNIVNRHFHLSPKLNIIRINFYVLSFARKDHNISIVSF